MSLNMFSPHLERKNTPSEYESVKFIDFLGNLL